VVVLLACSSATIAWLGFDAIRTCGDLVAQIDNASNRAVLGEQLNGLVVNVVMDSRGIYMSRDRAEMEKFAPSLLGNVALLEQKAARWQALLPPPRRHDLDATLANLEQFIRFRRELVRLGREESADSAREYGDNDAARSNRQALNAQIATLAAANAAEVDALTRKLEAYRANAPGWILGITLVGIGLSLVLAIGVVIVAVTRPLGRITAAVRRLAQGNMNVTVPGIGRGDEIGTIAVAVEVFKASMIEVAELRDRRRAELEADRMRGLANAAVEGLLICDGTTIVSINNSLAELVGTVPAATLGQDLRILLPDDDARAQFPNAARVPVETVLRASGGSLIPVEIICRPVDFAGKTHHAIAVRDLRDRRKVENELRQARLFLKTVIDSVPTIIVVKDARDFRYVLINRAAEEFYGLLRDEVIGKTVYDIYPEDTADFITRKYRRLNSKVHSELVSEHEVETPRNGTRRILARSLPIMQDGAPEHVLTVIEDVTERRRIEARVAHLAYHDALTNLSNRAAFNDHLAAMLDRGAQSGEGFALVCIDLDHFKQINDACGHATGDALLCEVAKRLRHVSEGAFVARLGGDEFTLIVSDTLRLAELAQRLLATVANEFVIGEHRLRIGISIGVAVYPMDGVDATALVTHADTALYRAKWAGRGGVAFFTEPADPGAPPRPRTKDRRADGGSDPWFLKPSGTIGSDA
jgi:diguanylate cyclase (GGDEF)-like protein/PAS domain S-box-containing protein